MKLSGAWLLAICLLMPLWSAGQIHAQEGHGALIRSFGETYYVPAYSRIRSLENRSELLASTLTIHNVDPDVTITIAGVSYHNASGEKIRDLLDTEISLPPFASGDFLIPVNDVSGGFGANFIAAWTSDAPALSPIVEAVMIGSPGSPGASFTSRGRVIMRSDSSN